MITIESAEQSSNPTAGLDIGPLGGISFYTSILFRPCFE